MTELSHAIVFLAEGCEGIAPELYAAAGTNQHLSSCGAPSLDACDLCLYELGRLRAALAAAAPVIETRVREEEREHFEAELRGERVVAYHDGVLAGIAARDRELAEAGRLLPEISEDQERSDE